jgi:hypothetical protein
MAADSRIELVSDGTPGGTKVVLIVHSSTGGEIRYTIPGVTEAQWSCSVPARANDMGRGRAVLNLRLQGVSANVSAPIDTSSTTVEDLLTEIVAGRLVRDKDDGQRFITGRDVFVEILMDEDLP